MYHDHSIVFPTVTFRRRNFLSVPAPPPIYVVRQHGAAERNTGDGGIKEIRRVGISYFRRNDRPVSDTRAPPCVEWTQSAPPTSSSSGSPIQLKYFLGNIFG